MAPALVYHVVNDYKDYGDCFDEVYWKCEVAVAIS